MNKPSPALGLTRREVLAAAGLMATTVAGLREAAASPPIQGPNTPPPVQPKEPLP
jgi:hypothetical protein